MVIKKEGNQRPVYGINFGEELNPLPGQFYRTVEDPEYRTAEFRMKTGGQLTIQLLDRTRSSTRRERQTATPSLIMTLGEIPKEAQEMSLTYIGFSVIQEGIELEGDLFVPGKGGKPIARASQWYYREKQGKGTFSFSQLCKGKLRFKVTYNESKTRPGEMPTN